MTDAWAIQHQQQDGSWATSQAWVSHSGALSEAAKMTKAAMVVRVVPVKLVPIINQKPSTPEGGGKQ